MRPNKHLHNGEACTALLQHSDDSLKKNYSSRVLTQQSKLNSFLKELKQATPLNWRGMAEALDKLANLDISEIKMLGTAINIFQELLPEFNSSLVEGVLRLQFYKIFSAYSIIHFTRKDIIEAKLKEKWIEQIEGLIAQINIEIRNPDIGKDNIPYLHAAQYHLTCAMAAAKLVTDNRSTNWAKHATELLSVAGSFFKLCESQGGQLADAAFSWAMEELDKKNTLDWYTKIGLIVTYHASIIKDDISIEDARKIGLQIQHLLTDENNKTFSPEWPVIYACIEALEPVLLKTGSTQEDFKRIINGGVDPQDKSKELIGLSQLINYDRLKSGDFRWCIRARMTQLVVTAKGSQSNPWLHSWGVLNYNHLKNKIIETKNSGGNIPKALLMLEYEFKEWSSYRERIKRNWRDESKGSGENLDALTDEFPLVESFILDVAEEPNNSTGVNEKNAFIKFFEKRSTLKVELITSLVDTIYNAQKESVLSTFKKALEVGDANITSECLEKVAQSDKAISYCLVYAIVENYKASKKAQGFFTRTGSSRPILKSLQNYMVTLDPKELQSVSKIIPGGRLAEILELMDLKTPDGMLDISKIEPVQINADTCLKK